MPPGILKIVLQVDEEHPKAARKKDRTGVNHKARHASIGPDRKDKDGDPAIVQYHLPRRDFCGVFGPTIGNRVGEKATYGNHQQGIAIQAVIDTFPEPGFMPFPQGHGVYFGGFTLIQVAQMAVMFVVIVLHHRKRCEREDTKPVARQHIAPFGRKQRIVPGVVLQHVKAHAGNRVQQGQRHNQPPNRPNLKCQPQGQDIDSERCHIADSGQTIIPFGPVACEAANLPLSVLAVGRGGLGQGRGHVHKSDPGLERSVDIGSFGP